ncbi:hypothetical protein E3E35_07975 [Thermococcus sp. GR7]|uniref:hypothetical protein n=1 Tax=unclassified Thermococcus TaxID=2627626 RepID=UPI00142F4E96|nr:MULTISPECIES: hypothetical protein [unclassified Thermococcus]NJE47336.1 hypothetical protein [Thermococcus sp. GR7]NJE79447.1 hypothetical protein [Thermococcus sp. GR4]NJF23174.1 hypothetical protein [Thermococcus sp. GR5]
MDNMVWITFFLTLLSGAITALIGVHIQHWYSRKKARKRLIEALKEEIRVNIRRLEESIQSLQEKSSTDISPFLTVCYEALITQDPELHYKISLETKHLDEAYTGLQVINMRYSLIGSVSLITSLIPFIEGDPESKINVLKGIKEKLENVLEVLDTMKI